MPSLFKKPTTEAVAEPDLVKDGGKGKATPTRKEAQAARLLTQRTAATVRAATTIQRRANPVIVSARTAWNRRLHRPAGHPRASHRHNP